MNSWEIGPIDSIPPFLRAIVKFLPGVCTLIFETFDECAAARKLYDRYKSPATLYPKRDTLAPRTRLYCCTTNQQLVEDLEIILGEHRKAEVFFHIKGFGESKMLFSFHDADSSGSAILAPSINIALIRAIAAEVGIEPIHFESKFDWNQDFSVKKK